ncbi:MAG: hypothetical protein RL033_5326 [Pseudomonadota bacterium]|jgi:hypothetical protein
MRWPSLSCESSSACLPWRSTLAWRAQAGLLLLGLAGSLLGAGCVTDTAHRGPAGREQASPPLDLTGDAPWPAPYDTDAFWRRAATGGDFERARLAQRESSTTLLTALMRGGSLGRTALAVLPYASDRAEIIGPLCELTLGPTPPTSSWLIDILFEAIAHAPRTEESVDRAAEARCADTLRQLTEQSGGSPEDRDRVLSALSLLAQQIPVAPRNSGR